MNARLTRASLLVSAAAVLAAIGVSLSGGLQVHLGSIRIRSTSILPWLATAVLAAAIALRVGVSAVSDASAWWADWTRRHAAALAIACAAAAIAAGMIWNTQAVGGSDSYCYVNAAELFVAGRVTQLEPLAARAPWPDALDAFLPPGHVPAAGRPATIVPMCAAGYPIVLAAADLIGGRSAMEWVVPLFAALAIWTTFALGRRLAGVETGLMAAILLLTSPVFLHQAIQPMSDVPAAAVWILALAAAVRAADEPERLGRAALAGVAIGAALMVRPNLVPVAAAVAGLASLSGATSVRSAIRALAACAAGILPFVVAIMLIHRAMYGGVLQSGYGDLTVLFSIRHVMPNLQRYPSWLLVTETPALLLAFGAPWALDRRRGQAWWLLAIVLITLACYVPYGVFEGWYQIRYLLPALPVLLVLEAEVILAVIAWLPRVWRVAVAAIAVSALLVVRLEAAGARDVFHQREAESRYQDAGNFAVSHLPANAAVISENQSGSIRFYADRLTVTWHGLAPDGLDRAVEFLKAEGYRPYFVLEVQEEPAFVARFKAHSPLGSLEWPPIAQINHELRVYDPDDRAAYLAGAHIATEQIWTKPR